MSEYNSTAVHLLVNGIKCHAVGLSVLRYIYQAVVQVLEKKRN